MKKILVTGCSSGIGQAVATGLRQRGYTVFATVRNEADRQPLLEAGIACFILDYAESDSVKAFAEKLLQSTDSLDAVFHNGAYGQPGAVEDLSRETIEKQFASNVFGWIQLTNLLLPMMRQQGRGTIIFNSSVLGLITLPFRGAYNASKFAIEAFADTLRMELRNTPIQVVLIEPGPIDSQFRANALKALQANVCIAGSVHEGRYKRVLRRLTTKGPAVPFTLPSEAVLQKVLKILESHQPRARYYVTFPTYLFGYLKRILPTRWLDKVLVTLGDR